MKHYDPYEDPAFDPDPFDEEDFLREVYDETPVYVVSVLDPYRYGQVLRTAEKIKAAVNARLSEQGKTARFSLDFDRELGLDVCLSILLPAEGLTVSLDETLALLRDVPDVWFSFSSPAWNRTEIRISFKNVKIAVERQ